MHWARADLVGSHASLQASEERFRSLVQNASDVTIILDARGQVTYVSPAADRVWGRQPDALLGTTVADLVGYLQWMSEPTASLRRQLGVWVILFLSLLAFLVWLSPEFIP